jgi:hypothetical protein
MDIYGVNLDNEVTPTLVRDAVVLCFTQAHFEDAQKSQGAKNLEEAEKLCLNKVKEAFEKTGGNFESPTKQSLINAIGFLAEFAKSFRDPSIIVKHKTQIMELITAIPGEPQVLPG